MTPLLPVLIFPRSVHSFNDRLRPYTFDENLYDEGSSPSVSPPTRTHAKLDAGGKPTHEARFIPIGSSGHCIHFRFFISIISVVFETRCVRGCDTPPIMMMDFVDPSSA